VSHFDNSLDKLVIPFFAQQSDITFALLFGSRANGITHPQSDWDFAVWFKNSSVDERFIQKEQLRQQLAQLLKTNSHQIDVIDLQSASLSLKSSVVADGIVLKGDDLLELILFYKRVWSLEEDFYWRLQNENSTLSS
jgi:predicted nucleotidyltransferase